MDRVLRLFIGQGMRLLVSWIANRGGPDLPPEQKAQQAQTARKMSQTMRVMRRVGRF